MADISSTVTLIKGGYIVSCDDAVGDLPIGDILIDHGLIASIDREQSPVRPICGAAWPAPNWASEAIRSESWPIQS